MNAIVMSLGVALAAPLVAADASKILLSGTTVSVDEAKAAGGAKAVVGAMTVSADAIAFEKETNTLKCDGAVTISVAGNVVTTRDCAIQLSRGEQKLFFLSRGEIQASPARYSPFGSTDLIGSSQDREKLIADFRTRTLLGDERGKPAESAQTFAAPPATQEQRKP